MRAVWLSLALPSLLQAQVALGRLYYTTAKGRALVFRVMDGGPGRICLAPETGDAEQVRVFILAHAGSEARKAPGAHVLNEPIPAA